jgi:adenylylsulfate kinase
MTTNSTTGKSKIQVGFTLWFTGLSGAGKSTIANILVEKISSEGLKVELLDGDKVRTHLSRGLGFSKEDRDKNIRRIGYVASLLSRNGVITITAAISPYREVRDEVRSMHENFVEVYVKCSLEVLEKRDVKGLYKKARLGEVKQFTGVSDPYEEPLNPEIVVETDKEAPDESTDKILNWLEQHNFLVSLFLCFSASLLLFSFPLPTFSANQPVIRPKIGLALGGGGAKGAAHIGVLRVLERENIPVDYLVGTSVGALIAALYSGGVNPDELEKYFLSGAIKKVYKTDLSIFRIILNHFNRVFRTFLGKPYYAGLYNDHKLHYFVDRVISKDDGTINLLIPLNIIAVDLVTGLPVVIKSGDVGLAVQASTAIPTLRQPIPISEQLLVDGGVLKNVPVEEAKKMGADIIIAVDVDAELETTKLSDFKTLEGVITRIITIGLKAQSEYVLDNADIVISPNLTGIGILDLDSKSLLRAIRAGEEVTVKKLTEIRNTIERKTKSLRLAEVN